MWRLLVAVRADSRLLDDTIGLIAELGRKLPVSCQYLGGCVNLFLVASGVGRRSAPPPARQIHSFRDTRESVGCADWTRRGSPAYTH
jgi:hypothetical protein